MASETEEINLNKSELFLLRFLSFQFVFSVLKKYTKTTVTQRPMHTS